MNFLRAAEKIALQSREEAKTAKNSFRTSRASLLRVTSFVIRCEFRVRISNLGSSSQLGKKRFERFSQSRDPFANALFRCVAEIQPQRVADVLADPEGCAGDKGDLVLCRFAEQFHRVDALRHAAPE